MRISRRNFVKMAGAAAALPRIAFAESAPAARRKSSRESLRELPYSSVQLTGGPFKRQYDALHAHYLSLDNDRLLKVYRQRAGLFAPAVGISGPYATDIREGKRVPHPRHWQVLAQLVGLSAHTN